VVVGTAVLLLLSLALLSCPSCLDCYSTVAPSHLTIQCYPLLSLFRYAVVVGTAALLLLSLVLLLRTALGDPGVVPRAGDHTQQQQQRGETTRVLGGDQQPSHQHQLESGNGNGTGEQGAGSPGRAPGAGVEGASSPGPAPSPRDREPPPYWVGGMAIRPRWCPGCHVYRPPRTSHCRVCDRCIERFDHHVSA
jgi:hypothetical protein